MRLDLPIADRCPDEELLAAFLEDHLGPEVREEIEGHLAGCGACLDVVVAVLPPRTRPASFEGTSAFPQAVVAPTLRPRPRSSARRWAMAATVILAVGAILAGAFRQPIAERATPALARLGTRLIGVPLQVGSIAVALGSDASSFVLTLGRVTIGEDPARLVSVDELGLTVTLAAPLWGEPLLTRVRAVRPVVAFPPEVSEKGLWWRDRHRALALLGRARHIELVEARGVLPVRGAGTFEFEAINGGILWTETEARVVLTGRVADGGIDVAGTVARDGRRLALTLGGRALEAAALPILAARVTGRMDLRVDVEGRIDSPRVDGRVALRNGRVLDSRPLWGVPLADASRDALAAIRPSLAGTDLPFEDGRASFRWRGGIWRLPRVFVDASGIVAGGWARIGADGRLNGRGTVRLPADIVTTLEPHEPAIARLRESTGTATLPFTAAGLVTAPRFTLAQ